MRIGLTKYGLREIITTTVVCAALAAVATALFAPAILLPAAVWLYVLAFFRDPERSSDERDALLSPADGKVVDISPVDDASPLEQKGTRIGIFMGLLDVHVNRSPCAGTVVKVEHSGGGYVDARLPTAAERNESATTTLAVERAGRTFPVVVRQVAGLIARRIVTDVRSGQVLQASQRIGMIKFGSRAELLAPAPLVGEVAVRIGQTVRGGSTVLIRLPRPEERA